MNASAPEENGQRRWLRLGARLAWLALTVGLWWLIANGHLPFPKWMSSAAVLLVLASAFCSGLVANWLMPVIKAPSDLPKRRITPEDV